MEYEDILFSNGEFYDGKYEEDMASHVLQREIRWPDSRIAEPPESDDEWQEDAWGSFEIPEEYREDYDYIWLGSRNTEYAQAAQYYDGTQWRDTTDV
jgi:hypothetical protein